MSIDRQDTLTKETKISHKRTCKCLECSVQTNYVRNLQLVNTYMDIKAFKCSICSIMFTERANLEMHIKNKHKENEYERDYKYTKLSYETKYKTLQRYRETYNDVKVFQCGICKASLERPIKCNHRKNDHGKNCRCPKCFRETNNNPLQRHLNIHTDIKANLPLRTRDKHIEIENGQDFKCPKSYETKYKTSQKHLNIHNGIKASQCDKHTKTEHRKDYKSPKCSYKTKYRTLQYDICMNKSIKHNLNRYIKEKHTENEHKNRKFKMIEQSKRHEYNNPYRCEICNMTFISKHNSNIHKDNRISDGLKKDYNCSAYSLINGTRGYRCDNCVMNIMKIDKKHKYQLSNRYAEKRTRKHYKCSLCSFVTNNSFSLRLHDDAHKQKPILRYFFIVE